MPDDQSSPALTRAIEQLLDVLSSSSSPAAPTVITVGVDADLSEADIFALAHRCAGADRRFAFVGDGIGFVGVGAAVDVCDGGSDAGSVAAALVAATAATPRRRFVVAVPFAPSSSSSSSSSPWRTHRRHALWAPRVWLHRRAAAGGAAVIELAVDHGDDTSTAARGVASAEARAILQRWLAPLALSRRPPRHAHAMESTPTLSAHALAIAAVVAGAGEDGPAKVVVARRQRLQLRGQDGAAVAVDDADAMVAGLARSTAREARYLVGHGLDVFFGCTPEWLCRRRGDAVAVDVIAGTAAVGDDAFMVNDKERREHDAVLGYVVGALSAVATDVAAPAVPRVMRLSHLQHLWTPVSARLRQPAPVFHHLHPTPAVAGVPTDAAMVALDAIEGFDRGLYSGVVGVAGADGEDLVVALRCGHCHDDVVDVYVGSGVVAGSTPAGEWAELDRKARMVGRGLGAAGWIVEDTTNEDRRGAA